MLSTGCQWHSLAQTEWVAHSTAHDRFQAWVDAGVFLKRWQTGVERFDELGEMDWAWLSMDGAMTKAPLGGEKTRPQPDRSGQGRVKRSPLAEGMGCPLAWRWQGPNATA